MLPAVQQVLTDDSPVQKVATLDREAQGLLAHTPAETIDKRWS